MISKETIKRHQLDTASLKKLFTAKKPGDGINNLVKLIADRIKEGRQKNFADYRVWAAVDVAYDTPFAQTTPTLLRNIIDNCNTPKEMLEALRGWGLSTETLFTCETVGEKKVYNLNIPVFTNVFVPLVRAYLVIRLSKLFNDRNTTPLFNYPPLHSTAENRLMCEIITDVVESIATNFGYSSTLRDFIFNALMYSVAIKFPIESWTKDDQEGAHGEVYTEKEGVQYVMPHITRLFYDLNYPLHTLNTGTGCAYAGYWTVLRWGDVANNTGYWNMDKVPHGFNWMNPQSPWANYWSEVYPCALKPPVVRSGGGRRTDREDMAAFYSQNDYDAAFFVTYIFMQIVPADWGIGDYKNKVWMKFTIGADQTVMFAETFTYRPIDYIGYDADSGRGQNASLALEIIPFQDLAGNALTQFLLTIKRNLTNLTFYNKEAVDGTQIQELNNKNNTQYTGLNFIGYDGLRMERSGTDMANVFKVAQFPYADPSPILLSLNTIISVLERVLVVAAQEIGATASHQQSKKEVELANMNTSNRVAFTGSFVDEGIDAWKRQLWEAALTNMSGKEVEASVSADIENLDELVSKLGFKINGSINDQKKIPIKGKLNFTRLVQLVARRNDNGHDSDMATAQAMFNAISSIANSQFLSGVVDPASLIELIQTASKLAGADEDFKITLNKDAQVANEVAKIVQQIQQQIMQAVEQQAIKPAAEAIGKVQQEADSNAKAIEQLTTILETLKNNAAPPVPPLNPAPNPTPKIPSQIPPTTPLNETQQPPAPAAAPEQAPVLT